MKPSSRIVRATILTDEIASAVPRNSVVTKRCSGFGSMLSGSISPSATPQANGTAMPARDTLAAVLPARRTRDRSVSMPVSNSSIRMPSCDTAPIIAAWSLPLGNNVACSSGAIAPSTLGPSRMPAISWPMIAGWPIRCIASPSSRPQTSSRMIWVRKTTSDGPCCASTAAAAGNGITASTSASAAPSRQALTIILGCPSRCTRAHMLGKRGREPNPGGRPPSTIAAAEGYSERSAECFNSFRIAFLEGPIGPDMVALVARPGIVRTTQNRLDHVDRPRITGAAIGVHIDLLRSQPLNAAGLS